MGREEEETRGGKRRRENFFQKERSGWRLKGEGGGGKDRKTNGRERERKRGRERERREREREGIARVYASLPRRDRSISSLVFFPTDQGFYHLVSFRFLSFFFLQKKNQRKS